MLYRFAPATDTCVPRLGIEGPGVYELTAVQAAALNERIDGKGGKPALIPVEVDAVEAKPGKPEAKAAKGKAAPVNPAPGVEVT